MSRARVSRRWFLGSAAAGGSALVGACAAPVATAPVAPAPVGAPAPLSGAPASVLPEGLFGPKPGVAQLSRNENPYGPSPAVYAAVEEATRKGAYYVDPAYLESLIAERYGVSPAMVTVSHGSGETLCAAAVAWGRRGAILVPGLFWDLTVKYAEQQGAALRRVPLTAALDIDLEAMASAVDSGVALVQVCNPNNPTGRLLDPGALSAFCQRVSQRATVLCDEAYNELTTDPAANTVLGLVRSGANVIVARTFSKIYGMAGMRIGYMISSPENIALIKRHQMSWMSAPAVAAAVAAFNDHQFLAYSKARVIEARELIVAKLVEVGLEHIPSEANFLYVKVPGGAEGFRQKMEARGILVRGAYGEYTEWSRVSMGRLEDVERYCAALPEVLRA
jgi:histidinol-phosphate aminotransferase